MATSGRHWISSPRSSQVFQATPSQSGANGARRSPSTPALAFLAAVYTLTALLTLACWHSQPGWALAGFLALTAWHFGSAEASVLLPDKTPWRSPVWWLFGVGRGLLVVFASLAFRPAQSALVLAPFASLGGNTDDVIHGLLRAAPTLLWLGAGLQTLGLCLEIRFQATRANQRSLSLEGLETGVLLLLFQVAPSPAGIRMLLDWLPCVAASPPHGRVPAPGRPSPALARGRRFPLANPAADPAFPPRFRGGLAVWPALLHDAVHRITAYLILLSALTVPHALVVGWLDCRATGPVAA